MRNNGGIVKEKQKCYLKEPRQGSNQHSLVVSRRTRYEMLYPLSYAAKILRTSLKSE